MKVLVTGGGGFIGSTLARALLERGENVRILDNFSTGRRENLLGLEAHVEVVEGELRSFEQVHSAARGVELVFHLGALPSVARSLQDPLTTDAVNAEGTLNVLLAARDVGVRRIVFASSSSVYGNSGVLPRVETATPDPISPYAVSKLAAERYCLSFSRVYGLETVVLRYFNVYGPRQDPTSPYAAVVPRFLSAVDASEPVTIYGDGTQSRDFTYVGDVVDATVRAGYAEGVNGGLINVAAGRSTTIGELADAVGLVLDRPVARKYLPRRPGEVHTSWADITRAATMLGYEPCVSLADGLTIAAEALAEPRVVG